MNVFGFRMSNLIRETEGLSLCFIDVCSPAALFIFPGRSQEAQFGRERWQSASVISEALGEKIIANSLINSTLRD